MKRSSSALLPAAGVLGGILASIGLDSSRSGRTRVDSHGLISIEEAIRRALALYPTARIVEAELEEDGQWEIELTGADERAWKIYLDGHSGELREDRAGGPD